MSLHHAGIWGETHAEASERLQELQALRAGSTADSGSN